MIDPPIIPTLIPNAWPIPKRAIPMVAIVLHELPVAKLTIAVIIAVTNRNIYGFNICKP